MKKIKSLGKQTKTSRGFRLLKFKDCYQAECSIQESSLADRRAIWLGLENADPKVLASKAGSLGVKTLETTGWVPYPMSGEVLLSTRMHLNEDQVKSLVKHLTKWVKTGRFT